MPCVAIPPAVATPFLPSLPTPRFRFVARWRALTHITVQGIMQHLHSSPHQQGCLIGPFTKLDVEDVTEEEEADAVEDEDVV